MIDDGRGCLFQARSQYDSVVKQVAKLQADARDAFAREDAAQAEVVRLRSEVQRVHREVMHTAMGSLSFDGWHGLLVFRVACGFISFQTASVRAEVDRVRASERDAETDEQNRMQQMQQLSPATTHASPFAPCSL